MRRKPFSRWLAGAFGRRAVSVTPAVWRTGNARVDAKIEIAQKSVRPRYAGLRQVEPHVGTVRAYQLAAKGSIPGIYIHERK